MPSIRSLGSFTANFQKSVASPVGNCKGKLKSRIVWKDNNTTRYNFAVNLKGKSPLTGKKEWVAVKFHGTDFLGNIKSIAGRFGITPGKILQIPPSELGVILELLAVNDFEHIFKDTPLITEPEQELISSLVAKIVRDIQNELEQGGGHITPQEIEHLKTHVNMHIFRTYCTADSDWFEWGNKESRDYIGKFITPTEIKDALLQKIATQTNYKEERNELLKASSKSEKKQFISQATERAQKEYQVEGPSEGFINILIFEALKLGRNKTHVTPTLARFVAGAFKA